jgi:formylglycine-generating enzyme required for sulfatase activity
MGVNGTITAAVSVTNETNIRALSTINYDDGNDQWQFFQASPPVNITSENSFNGSIELSVSPYVGVGLTLAFISYDTANAGIFLDSNLRFNANVDSALPQINWDYGYFFELNVEANVNVMGTFMDVDYDSTLWDSDYTQLGQGTYYLSSLENTSPLDNAVLNTNPIVFGWSSTLSEPVTYAVFMGDTETNLDVIGTSSSLTYVLTDTPTNGTYFWKVFALNNDDIIISESSIFSFEFDETISTPTVTTTPITQITQTTATSGGNIVNDGGSLITSRGVCYSINPNPTIANNTTSDGLNVGVFTSNITSLTQNTTYYVRAYATNSSGTAYGDEIEFTTQNSGGSGTYPGQTVFVQGGSYQMGSDSGQSQEQPIHTVSLSSFNIGKYEVTNAEYATFMNAIGANSSGSVGGTEYVDMDSSWFQINYTGGQFIVDAGKASHPVIEVTWFGAKAFAEYYGGRLPTEAEWEFAARGGNNSNGYTYSGSNTVGDVAWYSSNSTGTGVRTQPIGTKAANELGIHDMSGNVWEWCNDWYDGNYYNSSPQNNPQGPSTGSVRVLRGGSWSNGADLCRSAYRSSGSPAFSNVSYGFRVVFP